MRRFNLTAAAAAAVISAAATLSPARSAPPTVTPSPGYDARLQEQRAATPPAVEPAVPAAKLVPGRHVRHRRDHAH